MVNQIKLSLPQPEYAALLKLALEEMRDPASQIRWMLREALIERGFLDAAETLPGSEKPIFHSQHKGE